MPVSTRVPRGLSDWAIDLPYLADQIHHQGAQLLAAASRGRTHRRSRAAWSAPRPRPDRERHLREPRWSITWRRLTGRSSGFHQVIAVLGQCVVKSCQFDRASVRRTVDKHIQRRGARCAGRVREDRQRRSGSLVNSCYWAWGCKVSVSSCATSSLPSVIVSWTTTGPADPTRSSAKTLIRSRDRRRRS